MSIHLLALPEMIGKAPGLDERLPDIFASVQIEAEAQRLLNALAMPEYMEAWMSPPDAERIECHPDGRSFDRFRIDLISCGRARCRIHCACLLSKPNKITYLWEIAGSVPSSRSMVEIRIWKYLDRCSLRLRHGGLRKRQEWEWHSRMWKNSLVKLRAVMEGTSPAASVSHATELNSEVA